MEQMVQKIRVTLSQIIRYFSHRKESLFIAGLLISYVVANFIFIVLITLLTDIWQLKLLQAVSITNIQDGAKTITAIFIAVLADANLSDSMTLLFSALVFSGGLVMMFFTYPNITDEEIKACRERNICNEKPLGILFYLALALVTIGQCGHKNYLKCLKWEEKLEELKIYDQRKLARQEGFTERIIKPILNRTARKKFWLQLKKNSPGIIGFLIAVFIIPKVVSSKRSQLLVRAGMLGLSSCLFIAGRLCLFTSQGPRGSPMLTVFHLIFVAFKKRHYDITATEKYFGDEIGGDDSQTIECEQENDDDVENEIDGTEGQGNNQSSVTRIDLTKQLRFLDKAALYYPSAEDPQIERKNGRLCTVKEVEDAKCFVRAALLSLTFLTYGLMRAVSRTFFVEQANNMDRHLGSINLPVQIFSIFPTIVEEKLVLFCRKFKRTEPHRRFHGAIRISLGMITSCFCFIVAFVVEAERLKALKSKRTLTAFWLIPQLILRALMNGLAKSGIKDFFDNEMPNSVSISYGTILSDGVIGVGKLLSVALLVVVDNITKKHGHPWFGYRINDTRLDKFYVIMIGFGIISCIIFATVALSVRRHRSITSR